MPSKLPLDDAKKLAKVHKGSRYTCLDINIFISMYVVGHSRKVSSSRRIKNQKNLCCVEKKKNKIKNKKNKKKTLELEDVKQIVLNRKGYCLFDEFINGL